MTRRLQDIEIALADRPGALAEFGETLGRAGVSLEGGKLKQGVPGQLGLLCRRMADADINMAAQYSDHDSSLVLVLAAKDYARAQSVAAEWGGRASPPRPTTP